MIKVESTPDGRFFQSIHILDFTSYPYHLHMVILNGKSLTVKDVVGVANCQERVQISPKAIVEMAASRESVERAMNSSQPVYALNTGVGLLADIRLNEGELEQMQVNLVRSHCCGVGEPLPKGAVRGMMLIRANVLAKGLMWRWYRANIIAGEPLTAITEGPCPQSA